MNSKMSIHDIIKESIALLKDKSNLSFQHGNVYHETFKGPTVEDLVGSVCFSEIFCGGVLPGILVDVQLPDTFSIVLFDVELLNTYREAKKSLTK